MCRRQMHKAQPRIVHRRQLSYAGSITRSLSKMPTIVLRLVNCFPSPLLFIFILFFLQWALFITRGRAHSLIFQSSRPFIALMHRPPNPTRTKEPRSPRAPRQTLPRHQRRTSQHTLQTPRLTYPKGPFQPEESSAAETSRALENAAPRSAWRL